jgi:predicted acylesterase/phospholipase RssA
MSTKPRAMMSRYPTSEHGCPLPVEKKVGIALSGGGSHGAFTAGIIHTAFTSYLKDGKLPRVSIIAGTSTGSLVAALLTQVYGRFRAGDDPERALADLKHVYTKTTQNEVGILPSGMICKVWNLLTKGGLMDIAPLKLLVDKYYEQKYFDAALGKSDPVVYVADVIDMPTGFGKQFYSNADHGRDVMCEAIFASCAQPVVMTPATIGGHWSTDGGVREVIPFREPMSNGCTHILAVALNEPHIDPGNDACMKDPKDVFGRIDRGLSVMNDEVARDDERMARMTAFLNRGRDILLHRGVSQELLDRAFPPAGPLPEEENAGSPGDPDPYDNHAYNTAVLRELLFFRLEQRSDMPDSNVFDEKNLTIMFRWGEELARKNADDIRNFLFEAGEFRV